MAKAILDGQELDLNSTTTITADQAIAEFDKALKVLASRVPGFAQSGLAFITARAAYELIHWMYKPELHPTPAALMEESLEEAQMLKASGTAAGGKKPIIQ